MKPAISYYGGKQNLLNKHIMPIIPPHKVYVQPFVGGGTIYWAKEPSQIQHINDYDYKIANLYDVIKNNFQQFKQYMFATTHAQFLHKEAKQYIKWFDQKQEINKSTNFQFDKIKLAWSIWVASNMSFTKIIGGGFAFANTNNETKSTANRKFRMLSGCYNERIKNTIIHNIDAIQLIQQTDSYDTFFYFDPPYANSDCGFYQGTQQVFYRLLNILPKLKGKFILSSYPDQKLTQMVKTYNFEYKEIIQKLLINRPTNKIQCITTNIKDDSLLF